MTECHIVDFLYETIVWGQLSFGGNSTCIFFNIYFLKLFTPHYNFIDLRKTLATRGVCKGFGLYSRLKTEPGLAL